MVNDFPSDFAVGCSSGFLSLFFPSTAQPSIPTKLSAQAIVIKQTRCMTNSTGVGERGPGGRSRRTTDSCAPSPNSWLEVLHVLDQRPLLFVAEFTSVGVPPVFDEVRAHADFDKLLHQ